MNSGLVLLVDDEEELRYSTSQALELHGLEVKAFASAEEVLARVGFGFRWCRGYRHPDARHRRDDAVASDS